MRVQGTQAGGWLEGMHDGREGRVEFVHDPTRENLSIAAATAKVIFQSGEDLPMCPIKYLVPVNPDGRPLQLNMDVGVLGGENKGETYTLREHAGETCGVSKGQMSFQELETDSLVMLSAKP